MRPRLQRSLLALAAIVLAWLVFASWDYEFERTATLSPNLRLVELVRAERSAFTGAGHAVPVFALPIPSRYDRILQQTLMRGDEVLWRGLHDDTPFGLPEEPNSALIDAVLDARRPVMMYPSRDERLVLFQPEAHRLPVRIFEVATKRALATPALDSMRSEYGYALRFHAWSDDSRVLFLRTHEDAEFARDASWAREIYRVDPLTGASARVARCVGDWIAGASHPTWVGTACADSSRP